MKLHKLFSFMIVSILVAFSTKDISAQDKPVQLALFNPVQIFNENTSITGLRIDILYGKNKNVTGFDWGLVNQSTSSKGVQWGFIGITDSFVGWQSNVVSLTDGNFEGLQWGLVNTAGSVNGVQIGLVNYAANMQKGLQIGLVNIIKRGGQFPVFPIVNWAF